MRPAGRHPRALTPAIAEAWDRNQFEVKTRWAQIEAGSTLRTVEAYRPQTERPEAEADKTYLWRLSFLLADTGHPEEALRLRSALVEHFRDAGDVNNLQATLGDQANILYARGDLDEAMALLKEQERICRQLGNLDGLQGSLRNQALMIGLPQDLRGLNVLDIGAWDGAFSFEAERRGASRVVAVDSFCWGGEGWGTRDGFDCARRVLNSKVEDREIEVLDLSPENVGVFDLVLFLGVLYHMKHPLLALERVASVCRGQLILRTQIDLASVDRPAMAFYPGTELNNDPTNWWGPNPAAVNAMLTTAGFSRAETVYTWFPPPATPGVPPSQGNAIFHAWR